MIDSLPAALAVAWLLARREFWGKSLLNGIVHLPLVMPPVVTGYLLLLTFGTKGPVGSLLAEVGIVFAFRWTGAARPSAGRVPIAGFLNPEGGFHPAGRRTFCPGRRAEARG